MKHKTTAISATTGRLIGPVAPGEAYVVVNQKKRYPRETDTRVHVEVILAGRRVELSLTPHAFRVAAERAAKNPEDCLASASLADRVLKFLLGRRR